MFVPGLSLKAGDGIIGAHDACDRRHFGRRQKPPHGTG
jgi:hypothetical protein